MSFAVYILYSSSHHRYYIGQTNNVDERVIRHNKGMERSTSAYRPWEMILAIEKSTRSEAMILEKKLKNLNTEDLEKFIRKYGGTPGVAR